MLRKIRIALAVFCFTLITLLFLDFTGTLHAWFGWLAKIQFLPALLAVNVGVVAMLVVLTLLFGRVYCSVICPLGVFQDVIAWFGKKPQKRRKLPYSYSPALSWLRYGMLGLFAAALVAGAGSLAALVEPYGAYGRIAQNLFAPLWQWGNNFFAYLAERFDSYAFYATDVWIRSAAVFGVAAVTCAVLVVLAWRNGRTWCNTVCPVGTVLGMLSRFSLFKPVINAGKCVDCNRCARNCKAACIDIKEHKIDYSRCVACMDCIGKCPKSAISYTRTRRGGEPVSAAQDKKDARAETRPQQKADMREEGGISRRRFLSLAALFASASVARAQEKNVDGGLALIEEKKIPIRTTPIVPPGARSLRNMARRCTGCQLCVSVCDNQVLRPSRKLTAFMQPEVSYERGYCRPECTKCSEVCPAGAILRIDTAEKSAIQVGHAVWVRENCVPLTDAQECGNCARHCPTEAIQMVPSDPGDEASFKIPVINTERCIGCGACENLCPARPFSAIYVEGHAVHRLI